MLDDGKPVDDYTSPLGFRWFKFTADQGFFLNGEHYYFKGANVHQDHAGWGDAVADSGFFRDVKLVKDAGFDFIRGSHYPHAPAFAAACDEWASCSGRKIVSGAPAVSRGGSWSASAYPTNPADEPGFEASVKASLRDMIRIHRNHPSIIVWSMDNEVFFTDNRVMPKVRNFAEQLVAYTHELDPTRPAAIGGCQRGEIDKLGDIAGYNGDGARLPEYQNPGIPSVVTEYGSTIDGSARQIRAGLGRLAGTPGADKKQAGSWRLPWRSGEAIWCAFDHGSIAGRNFGAMGLVDYFRLPKRQWYWYRNEYRHIPPPAWPGTAFLPALKLTADKTTLNSVDGTDDAQIIVTVLDKDGKAINNCPPVTLTIESGPGEFPTGPTITFEPESDIPIRDGQAAMEFRSYYAGKTLIRATSPGLQDATIEIISLGEPQFIAGQTPSVEPRPYVRFTGNCQHARHALAGKPDPRQQRRAWPQRTPGERRQSRHVLAGRRRRHERVVASGLGTHRDGEQTKLTFPTEGNWRYQIEISDDGESGWKMVADQTQNASRAKLQVQSALSGAHGRFLRVTITAPPDQMAGGVVGGRGGGHARHAIAMTLIQLDWA